MYRLIIKAVLTLFILVIISDFVHRGYRTKYKTKYNIVAFILNCPFVRNYISKAPRGRTLSNLKEIDRIPALLIGVTSV